MGVLLDISVTVLNGLGFLFVLGFALLPVWAVFMFLRTRDVRTILLKLVLYYGIALSLRFVMVDVPLMALGYLNELTAESASEIHQFSNNAVQIIEGNQVEFAPTATAVDEVIVATPVIIDLVPTAIGTAVIITPQVVMLTPTPQVDWVPEVKEPAVATFDASRWQPGDPLPTPSR